MLLFRALHGPCTRKYTTARPGVQVRSRAAAPPLYAYFTAALRKAGGRARPFRRIIKAERNGLGQRGAPARRPQEACDMKHEKKQAPRFAKWLAKAAAAYLFFFLTGLLMGLVPAGSLGLSGPAFFSLRMC